MTSHQRKQITKAIKAAEKKGFRVEVVHKGHTWGYLICCGCGENLRIDCTPRDADAIAKGINEFVRKHQRAHG